MASDYTQLSEDLFAAMSTITAEQLKSLKFDKTIKCSITDATNAEKGEYIVSDGSTTFTAYSETTTYRKGNYVYVLVPNGDFALQKTILGKFVTVDSEYYTYVKQSDRFVNITGNILVSHGNYEDVPYELVANGEIEERLIWKSSQLNIGEYDRLVLKADFKTWLQKYNLSEGNYGLRLDIAALDNTTTQVDNEMQYYSFSLDSELMYGNPYNFETFYPQERIIDLKPITDNKNITYMNLYLYQKNNFKSDGKRITPNTLSSNIFLDIEGVELCFGYALEDFEEDTLLLYTLDSKYYATYLTDARKEALKVPANASPEQLNSLLNNFNQKTLQACFVYRLEGSGVDSNIGQQEFAVAYNIEDLDENTTIHWYKYKLAEGVYDTLAGAFWEEMEEYKNCFYIPQFYPDITERDQKIKVIIESPSAKSIEASIDTNVESATTKFWYDIYNTYKDDEVGLYAQIKANGADFSIDDVKAIAETYSLKVSKVYGNQKIYRSAILTLENECVVADKATVDLVQGLKVEVDKAGYKGIYRIYKDNGEIMSSSESVRRRLLTATYTSLVTGEESLDTAEAITWIFPTINTMIYPPEDGVEYDKKNGDLVEERDGRIYITRYGAMSTSEPGSEEADSTQQYFRIKDYYSQSHSDNKIVCRITKNNVVYEAIAELTFGPVGTHGTDYTLTLEYESKSPAMTLGEESIIIPRVYDYEDNDITAAFEPSQFTYSWYSEGNGGISLHQDGQRAILQANENIGDCSYYILQVTLKSVSIVTDGTNNQRNVTLKQYMPIAVRKNYDYVAFDGADKIAYNTSGVSPDYYKNPYAIYIYDGHTKKLEDVNWLMSFGNDTTGSDSRGAKYYPQVSLDGKLTVPSMYLQDNGKKIAVIASYQGEIIWTQPIRVFQYVYDSAMLNAWDGNLTIDEENGTILSAMLGAGKKDNENRFEGVLMGDVSKASDHTSDIGLYGYHAGAQSFGFKIDGTAFIGKKGKGQILFDGNSGRIQSLSYQQDKTGMMIDLDDGKIDIRGSKSNGAANTSTSSPSYTSTGSQVLIQSLDPYLTIRTEKDIEIMRIGTQRYYLQSENYNGGSIGTRFDIADGHLVFYDKDGSGGYVRLRGDNSTYFQIYSGTNTLINISPGNYYLQSNDWNSSSSGIRIDMTRGSFTARQGQGQVFISGSNSQFFRINSSTGDTLMSVSDSDTFLQSNHFSTSQGIRLSLNQHNPGIEAYGNFHLTATSSQTPGASVMLSTVGSHPFAIISDSGRFIVGWDGSITTNGFCVRSDGSFFGANGFFEVKEDGTLFCTSGKIGGWIIVNDYLYSEGEGTILHSEGSIYHGKVGQADAWVLSKDGSVWFGGNTRIGGSAKIEGTIDVAGGGNIGEWTLGKNGSLSSDNAHFYPDGSFRAGEVYAGTSAGENQYLTTPGLNVGKVGIACEAGIDCKNIGNNSGAMEADGDWNFGGLVNATSGFQVDGTSGVSETFKVVTGVSWKDYTVDASGAGFATETVSHINYQNTRLIVVNCGIITAIGGTQNES